MVILPGRRNWHGLNLAAKIDQVTRARTGGRAVSIGLTESIKDGGPPPPHEQADIALYEAKRTRLAPSPIHPGLSPAVDGDRDDLPSHEQRALAAASRARRRREGCRDEEPLRDGGAALASRFGERLQIERPVSSACGSPDCSRRRQDRVADAILQKPGALAPDELSAMTEHVEIGHAILARGGASDRGALGAPSHERIDGGGYPAGLTAASIPVESRIIAVADAFEAMTGTRPYRDAISVEEAIVEAPGKRRDAVRRPFVLTRWSTWSTKPPRRPTSSGSAHGGSFKVPLASRNDAVPVGARI